MDISLLPLAAFVHGGFWILPLPAWNFHFPSTAEEHLWRISRAYAAGFSLYGGLYCLLEVLLSTQLRGRDKKNLPLPPIEVCLQQQHLESGHEDSCECIKVDLLGTISDTPLFLIL